MAARRSLAVAGLRAEPNEEADTEGRVSSCRVGVVGEEMGSKSCFWVCPCPCPSPCPCPCPCRWLWLWFWTWAWAWLRIAIDARRGEGVAKDEVLLLDRVLVLLTSFRALCELSGKEASNASVLRASRSFSASWLRCLIASACLASNSNFGFSFQVIEPTKVANCAGLLMEKRWTGWLSFTRPKGRTKAPIFSS
jgi:hypothetical protein